MDRIATDPARERVAPGPAPGIAPEGLATGALALGLAAVAVGLPRLMPAVGPGDAMLATLPALATLAAVAAAAGATLVTLVRGLRDGRAAELVRTAGLAVLTAALLLVAFRVSADAARFPDPGLAVAAPLAAALAAAARGVPDRRLSARWTTPAWVAIFGGVELALAAALLLEPGAALRPWLLGLAAAGFAAGADRRRWLGAGLLAVGCAALAAGRDGSLDAVPALLTLGVGSLALATPTAGGDRERSTPAETASPAVEPVGGGPWRPAAGGPQAPEPAMGTTDDATRLARELRGTIEELLRARRTIELQRDELARLAAVDPLTGVATRRAILERLRTEAAEARRYGHPVAALLLDIDAFGRLNREHGSGVGDEVLREVALRLRLRMRAADAIGRVGGNRFLALMPHTDEAGAARFADALRGRLLDRPYETAAGELRVTLSIGIAFMRPGMGLTDEELLGAAEEALASARAAGGNRIAFDRLHGLIRIDERRAGDDRAG